MATNMPPHNLGEAIDAVVQLIDKPDANVEDLMKHLKGPDFPTGAIIVGRSGIRDAYRTGPRPHRHARPRSRGGAARREERDRRHRVPYGVKKGSDSGVIKKIADLVNEKVITEVSGSHRSLRPLRDADPDRAQAGGDPTGRPQQALQAHGAAVDLRLQRRRARGRRAPDDVAARAGRATISTTSARS